MMKSPYKSTIHIIFMGISLLFATHKIAYCDKKDIQEANESHKEISSNNIQSDQLYDNGNKFYIQKKYRDAIECYKKAIEIDNKKWTIYYNLARAQTKNGDNQEAIKNLNIFLKHYPNDPKGIDLKRVIAGTSAAYQGPLTVFLISFNKSGLGFFEIYNTSDKDVSVIVCNPLQMRSPKGTAKMKTGDLFVSENQISDTFEQGNIRYMVNIQAHNKYKVGFQGHYGEDKELLMRLNDSDLEQAMLYFTIGYQNTGDVGMGTVWHSQISLTNK